MIYTILAWPLLGAAYYPYQRWACIKERKAEFANIWYSMATGPLGWMVVIPLILVYMIAIIFTLLDKQVNEEI